MKKIFTLLICLYGIAVYAQNKSYTINWSGSKSLQTESFTATVPFFKNKNNFSFDMDEGLLFTHEFSVSAAINSNTASITNIQYATISKEELKDLIYYKIPSDISFSLNNAIDRGKVNAFLKLSPIIKEGNSYKKVISFSINYSSSSSLASSFSTQAVTNSVLATGEWFKFIIDKSGVYKLDKNFLNGLGINTNSINPKNIKIYGNGGHMIPYINSDIHPIDPTENAIKVIGENDGVFNDGDYILFYAEGPRGFNQISNTHENIYNTETQYYITVSAGNGKRIQPFIQPAQSAQENLTVFRDYQYHETDEFNLAAVGRRWFGDKFDIENTKVFQFNFPDLVSTDPIDVKVIAASASGSPSSMKISVNGTQQSVLNFPGLAATNGLLVNEAIYNGTIPASNDLVTVQLEHNKQGNPSSEAFIDYITVKATRTLRFNGTQFSFTPNYANPNSTTVNLTLDNTAQVQEVWEVSDLFNVKTIVNPNLNQMSFRTNVTSEPKFNIVTNQNYYLPRYSSNSRVFNSNIKGTIFKNSNGVFQDIDYLMLTTTSHLSQANRLAQINRDKKGLNVKVVTVESIYNEFNCGNPDIAAIRNLVRYVYTNASNPNNRLKYLCLFGDTSYDYKGRISSNLYNLPTWNALSSFNLTTSFISDDFYGMMDLGEGNLNTSDRLDIAVGRIVADSPLKAKQMVDKVEKHYSINSIGSWRNNVLVVSDDVDVDWERVLQNTTDQIGNEISQQKPFINVKKIHSDAYQQQATAGGDRYPEVNSAISNEAEKGVLVVNYFGHGGEDGLASERIYNISEVVNLRNVCKYHCFVTVTCEYTKFDNPLRLTAGEFTYWNPDGGAIALITTTRQIFVPVGVAVNVTLGEYLYSYSTNDTFGPNEYPSIAEALRLTKNNPNVSSTQQKLLIFAIGDPALELPIPQPNIKLTKVNDEPIASQTEPLKALGYAKIEGEVQSENGTLLSNYNGILTTIIFDKNEQRTTLANDNTTFNGNVIKLDYENLGPTIYRGQATVTNGRFSFDFIVPRDISVPVGNGRVSFYANQENSLDDKTGASVDELLIGGINLDAPEDNIGPAITLHINDKSFASGGITNTEPLLLVSLEDANGINTASGIGHDITAILDGDEVNPYVLNDYYLTEVDDYTKGSLEFKFRDLEPGLHTLTLKAWDVYNNSSTSEIQFVVYDENTELVIDKVLNYPNPFINYTEFWFTHNSSEPLDISVQIFTVSGKIVRTLNGQTTSDNCCNQGGATLSRDIVWDGRDDFGDKIGKGTYIYKIKVHSKTLNKTVEKIEKLVILQ
ncbi:type IX secretion system sortase PorU [Aurantibacter aestuarii]|uniref:Peptidase C25 n=1 Tax=Aurantibacter aestuarii TaxID=1266046 RepID=A0A2T1N6Y9_9FLAO|nr:type IX secretion system sortase PorU [Aurantibacter aestuarii]PSG87339.1 peptidase C25 [Aurantibacter aestuarii]